MLAALGALAVAPATASAASTIAVDSTEDAALESGASTCVSTDSEKDCTLRAALELAASEGGQVTIQVPAGTYRQTAGPRIAEGAEVTIAGAGAGKTVIEGNGTTDVLEVEPDESLTITGVTVTGGAEDEGGGLWVGENATFVAEESEITGNAAHDEGGAVFAEPDASVTIRRSHVTKNQSDALGGGIFARADASILIDESTLEENDATSDGGAIFAESGSSVTVRGSTVASNHAEGAGGGIFAAVGATVLVEGSTLAENKADLGGGIAIDEEPESDCEVAPTVRGAAHRSSASRLAGPLTETLGTGLTVVRSSIEKNAASGLPGGGIFFGRPCRYEEAPDAVGRAAITPGAEEAALTIEQSAITGNEADNREEGIGGGIYEETEVDDPIIDSTIASNLAAFTGGGIADGEGTEALVSDTVANNTIETSEPEEPEEEEVREDARPAWRTSRGARPQVADTVTQATNLAADPDGLATIELRNTIVSQTGSETSNCEGEISSLVSGSGYNLDYPSTTVDGVDTCGMTAAEHDLVGRDPLFDAEGLRNNGGTTDTIALTEHSPALGAVPLEEDCDQEGTGPALPNEEGKPVAVDQRGEPRPDNAGENCDVGAYEYQAPAPEKEVTPKPSTGAVLPFIVSSPPACTSKRDITIHIQNVKQFGIVSAVVSVDGKARRTLRGAHLSTAINLVGLPKGTFTVEIAARTRGGQTLHGRRVYHTCHNRLPGSLSLRL